mmetsp:Transcript_21262/g.30743  ORF Transcript_21262/g.30743 Transcript_21262/m.30743 type:complete len:155 (-) Transcript_21262:119-583(-)|eukprot:CAMPEP_0185017826 /NCGR_PEP_ID=MMETSP1103-20130426/711_1 /TAXON_ID=36769 /ORGANISM="Paraphysomonas bandaiensis, Strain Caron Lab Isolate" /LENGTH=154 /DNA_ID=CAMNT_0027547409 /DNA_START=152 /DNA_END=616 /DNA_ORIENTATION=+
MYAGRNDTLFNPAELLYLEVSFVKSVVESSCIVEIPVSDTVESLKERVLEEFDIGILADNYALYSNGKQLDESLYVSDCGLVDWDTIHLKEKNSNSRMRSIANSQDVIDFGYEDSTVDDFGYRHIFRNVLNLLCCVRDDAGDDIGACYLENSRE